MEDKKVLKYLEHMPYGNDAKSSEIHGKKNQVYINEFVSKLVLQYDALFASGDKQGAEHIASTIRHIAMQLNQLKDIKTEFAMTYGGGTAGKNMFSNYTDLSWERKFFLEEGVIGFSEGFKLILTITNDKGELVSKNLEDITTNWVIKSTEETDYMRMHQDLVKQGQTAIKHPDFNIDWSVDKLLVNNDAWKIFVSDKIGGVYFLHEWMQENREALNAGQVPDEMLYPDSFHPEQDTMLHQHYANRLKAAFDPNYTTIKDGNKSSSTIDGRTTMGEIAEEQPQEQQQNEGPIRVADNKVPNIKE